ncbi:MAG: glycoside hydrolase family 25 protein, partial [Kordiimonas sp.]
TDAELKTNWAGVAKNNLMYGGYHIFVPDDDGAAQAKNYLDSLRSVTPSYAGRLRPVLDVESIPEDKLQEAFPHMKIWLQRVEEALGCKPMIYTSPNNWNREFPDDFTNYPLWLADYNDPPTLPKGWSKWTFWQHTNSGHISGIAVPVDLDIYDGDKMRIVRDTCPIQ